ncbi:hypothetical protein Dimus_037374 [Dionaea muscipula]
MSVRDTRVGRWFVIYDLHLLVDVATVLGCVCLHSSCFEVWVFVDAISAMLFTVASRGLVTVYVAYCITLLTIISRDCDLEGAITQDAFGLTFGSSGWSFD